MNRTLLDRELSDQLGYATRVLDALARFHEDGRTAVAAREVTRRLNNGRAPDTTRALHALAECRWVIHDDARPATPWVLHPGLSQWVEKYR